MPSLSNGDLALASRRQLCTGNAEAVSRTLALSKTTLRIAVCPRSDTLILFDISAQPIASGISPVHVHWPPDSCNGRCAMVSRSSAYMVQFSNGSLQNQLISRDQLLLAMRVGLLFFDEAHVSARALIRNDVLFDLSATERDAMRSVYRNFLRPLTLAKGVNIVDVANAVVKSDLKIGFHRDKGFRSPIVSEEEFNRYDRDPLLSHAEFIRGARPKYIVAPSRFRQSDFGKRLFSAFERIASIDEQMTPICFISISQSGSKL